MQRLLFAALSFVLAAAMAPAAQAATRLNVLTPNVSSGTPVQVRVQVLDETGKPASGPIVVTAVRVDMGPDHMADMTTPAKALPSKAPSIVTIETNLYAPGRWAVTVSGKIGGKLFSGTVVVTAIMKKAEAAQPPPAPSRKILYYRNPMGLADTSPVPKKDAMGMAYIPVYADATHLKPGTVRLSVEKMQRAGVRTDVVRRQSLTKSVRAAGIVATDENRQAIVTARFDGFIEKLFVSQTGDKVRTGQALMRVWIQSPEVLVKEADYVAALSSHTDAYAAQAAAILRQYGVPSAEIADMAKTGRTKRSIVIAAPSSGTVMEKNAVTGMRFAAGDTLFKITDVSKLWVLADISERDLAAVKAGQSASVTFRDNPDVAFAGKVLMLYPALDGATRTAKARIAVANAGGALRIGQYADVRIGAPIARAPVLTVPASAVIDDGTKAVAFVAKAGGLFEPRLLKLGVRSGDMVEVRSGLNEGERIVTSGNFLIDAESNLQSSLQSFSAGGSR